MIDHSENQYALDRNNNLVSVFDVPTGEACDCRCTKCGEPVAAKNKGKTRDTELKPNQRAAHFYHIVSKSCQGETLVHILAKEIIKESKRLIFEIPKNHVHGSLKKILYQEVNFDEVILEERLNIGDSYIIPDITAKVKDRNLYIEIVYQNNLSPSKRKLILKNKLSFLAINFNVNDINWNEYKTESQLEEKIRWFLFESEPKHQTWIYNPKLKPEPNNETSTENYNSSQRQQETNIKHIEDSIESDNRTNYEPSLSVQLLLDKESTQKKLERIALALDYGELWFVEEILKWEDKYLYFMHDKNFETIGAELKLKPEIESELLDLQKENLMEWHQEYDRMKRRKFFK